MHGAGRPYGRRVTSGGPRPTTCLEHEVRRDRQTRARMVERSVTGDPAPDGPALLATSQQGLCRAAVLNGHIADDRRTPSGGDAAREQSADRCRWCRGRRLRDIGSLNGLIPGRLDLRYLRRIDPCHEGNGRRQQELRSGGATTVGGAFTFWSPGAIRWCARSVSGLMVAVVRRQRISTIDFTCAIGADLQHGRRWVRQARQGVMRARRLQWQRQSRHHPNQSQQETCPSRLSPTHAESYALSGGAVNCGRVGRTAGPPIPSGHHRCDGVGNAPSELPQPAHLHQQ